MFRPILPVFVAPEGSQNADNCAEYLPVNSCEESNALEDCDTDRNNDYLIYGHNDAITPAGPPPNM